MTETDIRELIRSDASRMRILQAVAALELDDWWIGAGFVRNAVWDELFGDGTQSLLNDVDVVYWKSLDSYDIARDELTKSLTSDKPNLVWDEEAGYERALAERVPGFAFEVKNQARMHLWSGKDAERKPYASAADGIADWVETATTIGVKLDDKENVLLCAGHGIDDLVQGIVRPTKPELTARARERAEKKGWFTKWPSLHFEDAL